VLIERTIVAMGYLRAAAFAACSVAAACSSEGTGPKAQAYTAIRSGAYHTCALTTLGAAECWGKDYYGPLGYGVFRDTSNVPRSVSGGLSFTSLGAGYENTCALGTDGRVYCWGSNNAGRLGDGSWTDRAVPGPVVGGITFASLTMSVDVACGLTAAGTAYCWGSNEYGDAGAPLSEIAITAPRQIDGGMTFRAISTNYEVTCGLTTAGAAYCWGSNEYGALGVDSSTAQSTTPVAVSGGLTFQSLTTGPARACGITAEGAVYCWGLMMGGDFSTNAYTPTLVQTSQAFASIAAGMGMQVCALTAAGAAWCWGPNAKGELGTTARLSGCTFSGPCTNVPVPVAGGLTFADLTTGGNGFTCGVTADHQAYCWGENGLGELGIGSYVNATLPTRVVGLRQ
jgi:alpha-tubulin suppressor-like RCC1 family protein